MYILIIYMHPCTMSSVHFTLVKRSLFMSTFNDDGIERQYDNVQVRKLFL